MAADKKREWIESLLVIAIIIPLAFLDGTVIRDGYNWFIRTQFHGPAMGVWQACGIGALVSRMTMQIPPKSDKSPLDRVLNSVFLTLATWATMWTIWHFGLP